MSRTVQDVTQEYGQVAAQLGQEAYLASLTQEQLDKHEYNIGKLKAKMQSLAKEAQKLKEEIPAQDAPVAQDAVEVPSEQS